MSQHLSSLASEIRNTLFHSSIADIVDGIGFRPVSRAAIDDLLRVAEDPRLGLDSEPPAGFVSSEDYLHKLGSLLKIDGVLISRAINQAKQQRILQSCAFPSWIFVRTQFIEGDAATARSLEHKRRLVLPASIRLQPHAKQLLMVKAIVRQHAAENHHSLDFWGKIVEYHFHYADDKKLVLGTNGGLSRATKKDRAKTLDIPCQLALLAA